MYYAVAKGHKTGVYTSWDDCQAQVIGYAQNQYMAFATKSEAEHYVQQSRNTATSHTQPFQGTASRVSSHFQSATQEDSRKRMLVENYGTPDCKRPRPTPTETNNNSSNQYQYSYYADYGVEDDDDPLRDYYHSHVFYGYLFQRSGKW